MTYPAGAGPAPAGLGAAAVTTTAALLECCASTLHKREKQKHSQGAALCTEQGHRMSLNIFNMPMKATVINLDSHIEART